MIIKSMSRKKASFSQLVDYMNKELSSPHTIGHNLYMGERTTSQDIINEFEQNAENLPKRKNGNYLYHEVISFEKNEIDQEKMDEIIIELAELYLSERAPKQLAYAVIHRDTEKPHIHFCISANELGSDKRKRLTKKKFSDLQKNLERYAQEKFPELDNKLIYTKERDSEKAKTTSREQELKKRTGKVSQKDLLKNKLHGLFELSNSKQELDQHLEKEGYAIYTRGKNAGIEKTATGKKHRLNTLGVMEHYLSALERFDSLEKGKRQQAQTKQQEAEQRAAQEQQKREEQQRQAELQEQQQKAAEEARQQAEEQRQAELMAQQQRAAEEASRQAEQQKQAEVLAEKQRAAEKVAVHQKKAAKDQQQREEYKAEKAAEEKRREAFLSRKAGKTPEQERQQQKPTKTQRRQRTEQVRTEEAKKQKQPNTSREATKEKAAQPAQVVQSDKPTQKRGKKPLKNKQKPYIERKAEEVEKELEDKHSTNPVEKGVKKATEFVSDRAAELKRIITGKDKNKDRER